MQKEFSDIQFGKHFIPFSTHISKKIVISKSGNISQTVRFQSTKDINMSANIMAAIKTFLTEDVFINIHAVHTQNTHTKPQSFTHFLLKAYSHTVASHNKYTQEFYVTISMHGHKIDIQNFGHFLLKKRFIMDVEHACLKLQTTVLEFCKKLEQYQPYILGITSHDDILHSENASFLYNVFYGKSAQIPIADMEISEMIKPVTISHGRNYIKVSRAKVQEFIAVLTIKEFPIADRQKMAELYTVDSQYIIAQSVYQAKNSDMMHIFGYQNRMVSTLRDNEINKKTGIGEIMLEKQPVCIQTAVIAQAGTIKELEEVVEKVLKKLQYIGLVACREDINAEQVFYSSLPANSSFMNRKEYTVLKNAGQFASSVDFLFQGVEKLKHTEFLPAVDTNKRLFAVSPFFKASTSHVLVNGSHIKAKSMLLNTFLLHLHKTSRILCMDSKYSSFALTKTLDGACVTHPMFNILNLLQYSVKSFATLLTACVKFYCIENQAIYEEEIAVEIETLSKQIKADTTLEEIFALTQNPLIIATFNYLASCNMLSENDTLLHQRQYFSLNIGEDFAKNYQIVCLYIMLFVTHTGQANDIVKIDKTFDVFTPDVISQKTIAEILKNAKAKHICFILCNDIPLEFEMNNVLKYQDVLGTIEFGIFIESVCATQFVKRFFQLKSNFGKSLMFVKQGTNKAAINNINYIFTVNLEKLLETKELDIFDITNPQYIENIKLIDTHKNNKDELLNIFLEKCGT